MVTGNDELRDTRSLNTVASKSSFFNRHTRFFTLAGAFIVFATFIVKDMMRDNLKDLASALASAEVNLHLRQDNLHLSDQLDQVDSRLDSLESESASEHAGFSKTEIQIRQMIYVGQQKIKTNQIAIDQSEPLIEEMSDHERLETRMLVLKGQNDALDAYRTVIVREFHEGVGHAERSERNYNVTGDWVSRCDKTKKSIEVAVNDTHDEAKSELRRDAHRVKWYTRISYVLYGFGWSIAFFGKLNGRTADEGG